MSFPLELLQEWDEKILHWVQHFGLNCYEQEFEICDHHEMIGYMAYSGMPSRYSHWSFGKNFEKQKTLYDYGVSGLPYEMVINSNPCLAYLMRDNTLLLQILTIAHVYGHNDFFANNFTFTSAFDARYTFETFKNHAHRITSYIEDPSIGLEGVESILDHAHALSFQTSRNLAIRKLSHEEQRERLYQQSLPKEDPYRDIHPKESYKQPNLEKIPPEPDEDLLQFIAAYNKYLPEWKRDLLRIVDKETRYFIPQMETKIMNEGWASYWHHKILNALNLETGLHMEFLVRHNQVLRPVPGGLNPYHLGFVLWQKIEAEENSKHGMTEEDYDPLTADTPGRKKMFLIRESDRDSSFLRRFLSEDIIRELNLFQHEKRGKDRIVTKVPDESSWESIKETLIKNVGTGSIPVIKIEDADFGRNRTLYLKHEYDGRELQLEYAEATLKHLYALWEREVVLETVLNDKRVMLRLDGKGIKIEKISSGKPFKQSADDED